MGALELAKQFAKAKAAEKPLADAFTQAKRAATGEKARLLYNLFAEFAGHEVNSPNGRGVLDVTVAHSLLVQELGFDKQRLVATLREAA